MWPLLLLAGLSSASPAPSTTVVARPAAQLAAVADAERLGRDIYDFDQAAWGSTDALLAAIPDPSAAGVRGWIVEREPAGTIAIFFGLNGSKPYKVFIAHMQGKTVLSSHVMDANDDRNMTTLERRMVEARIIALTPDTLKKINFRPCSNALVNSVVLPPATADAPVPVYILTPQSTMASFPIGGHYRVDIAADGSIAASRPFAKSCIVMDRANMPENSKMFVLTHLLDPQPTEIHVWLSLVAGLPLAVATLPAGDVWTVANGAIKYQYTLPAPGPFKP
jgi:hypothetical protein